MENSMSKLNDKDKQNHDKLRFFIRNEIIGLLHYLSFLIFRTMIPVYLGKYGLVLNIIISGVLILNKYLYWKESIN